MELSLICSYCPEAAETVHLLPGGRDFANAVRFACDGHDPGGYRFAARSWADATPSVHERAKRFTARDRLARDHGKVGVSLVERALAARQGVGDWDGPANVEPGLYALMDGIYDGPRCGRCRAPAEFQNAAGTVFLCAGCRSDLEPVAGDNATTLRGLLGMHVVDVTASPLEPLEPLAGAPFLLPGCAAQLAGPGRRKIPSGANHRL